MYSNAADLTLERVTIEKNNATDDNGGNFVDVASGRLTLRESVIDGRGIEESMTGLRVGGPSASAFVDRSTISGFTASGIFVYAGAALDLQGSTLAENYVGLFVASNASVSSASVRSSTFFNNTYRGINASPYNGGAVLLSLQNSIVAAHESGEACASGDKDDDTSFIAEYNIYSDATCVSDNFQDNSLPSTTATLSELADWGGPTPTYVPLSGSVAIDWAPSSVCADDGTDQRGMPRPVAHVGNVEPRCDAGAVELEALVVPDDPWGAEIFLDGFEGEG